MQEDYYAPYREYLRDGMRIEIGIPLSGGGVFRDWAIIAHAAGDELLAQISRDILPSDVRVDVGFILDVSIRIKNDAYTCSGIVIEKDKGRMLRIRLFGAFTLRERRQFFRVDLEMRLRYAPIMDGDRRGIERDWSHRRELELMKFQGYDQIVIAAHTARFEPEMPLDWRETLSTAGNLGGGGMLISLPESYYTEQLLGFEIYLPVSPPRTIHCVAQVIHTPGPRLKEGKNTFAIGVNFIFLDERDRDLLFRHISASQIALLKKIADSRELPPLAQQSGGEAVDVRQVLFRVLLALLVLIAMYLLTKQLIQYQQNAPPNEIGETYERALKQYRHEEK